ncbi:hypothetical protein KCU92_g304, partial [Aureobasidium melanogenum]
MEARFLNNKFRGNCSCQGDHVPETKRLYRVAGICTQPLAQAMLAARFNEQVIRQRSTRITDEQQVALNNVIVQAAVNAFGNPFSGVRGRFMWPCYRLYLATRTFDIQHDETPEKLLGSGLMYSVYFSSCRKPPLQTLKLAKLQPIGSEPAEPNKMGQPHHTITKDDIPGDDESEDKDEDESVDDEKEPRYQKLKKRKVKASEKWVLGSATPLQ